MKIINFLITFFIVFFSFSFCLLFGLDQTFYASLTSHLFKPSLTFFHIFNLLYAILISLAITDVIFVYHFRNLNTSFYVKVFINFISFILIRVFFNTRCLVLTFLCTLVLFISLLYVYEEIFFLNEKSTKYLDFNVLYSLILSAFTFCLYVLNCS